MYLSLRKDGLWVRGLLRWIGDVVLVRNSAVIGVVSGLSPVIGLSCGCMALMIVRRSVRNVWFLVALIHLCWSGGLEQIGLL